MFLNSLVLAISSSIDSLGIGITYGIKNTKISYVGSIILFIVSFINAIISIWLGNSIKSIFPEEIAKYIGSLLLILMGMFMIYQSLKKENRNVKEKEEVKEKIYSFFIDFLGITIQIIKNPANSDFDNSNKIDAKEALFLGLALSLDSICIGTSSSMVGISSGIYPFFISIFQILFLSIGNIIGKKLNKFSKIPDNIWSVLAGILLISISIIKFIST